MNSFAQNRIQCRLLVAILCTMIMLNVGNISAQNAEIMNIKGNVISMTEKSTTYSYYNGEYSKVGQSAQRVTRFGSKGEIIDNQQDSTNIKKIIYDNGYIEKTFDNARELISKITVDEKRHKLTVDHPNATFVCTYNESIHRPTSAKFFPCRGCKRQEGKIALFKYDKQGNIVLITNYIDQIEVNGEPISSSPQRSYNPNYNYAIKFDYEYDEQGNWICRKRYNSAGTLTEWLERDYEYLQAADEPTERDNTYDSE